MDFNNDKMELLLALREITKLGPINQLRIKKASNLAKKLAFKEETYPIGNINVDYSIPNSLELQLRMVALAKALTPLWQKYVSVGEYKSGLSDFVRDYLDNYIASKNKEVTKSLKK